MSRGKRPSSLSDEDRAVWQIVADKVERVRVKSRAHPAVPDAEPEPPKPTARTSAAARTARAPALQAPPATVKPAGPPPPRRPAPASTAAPRPRAPALPAIDRKTIRRLGSGQLDLDARLDLHGMTQDEAHRALRAFLAACRNRGDRFTLVITGKGGAASIDHGERGVLRRNVPRWLAEPDLAPLVVGIAQAAIRHGGSGALYVRVRVRDL